MSEFDGVSSHSLDAALALEAPVPIPGKQTLVQRAAGGGAPSDPAVVQPIAEHGVAGSGGPVPFREQMEAGFGVDFSEVRFHGGGSAAAASRAIGAEAYTRGPDIAMAASPTPQLVAHELAHVVQQRAGAGPASGVGAAGDGFEREADHAAAAVASGGQSDLAARYGGAAGGWSTQRQAVQRFESGEHAMIGVGPATSGYPDGEGDLALPSGAVIFMGEMVAFGDFYADMQQLQEAPRQEIDVLAGTCRLEAIWNVARRLAGEAAGNRVHAQVAPNAPGASASLIASSSGTVGAGTEAGPHVTPGAVPAPAPGGGQEARLRNQPHNLDGNDPIWDSGTINGKTLREVKQAIFNRFTSVWSLYGIGFDVDHKPESGMAMVRATVGRRRFRGENDALARPGDPSAPNPTRDPTRAGGDYLDLAQNNLSHFTTDNWDNWLAMHRAACAEHAAAGADARRAEMAIATDMMGGHFLTDRFSTGHFVDKSELMTYATRMMANTARANLPAQAGESTDHLLQRELQQAVSECFQDGNVLNAWRAGVAEAQANGVLGEREAQLLGSVLPSVYPSMLAEKLVGVIMAMPWRGFDPSEASDTSSAGRNYGPNSRPRSSATPSTGVGADGVSTAGDYHLGVGNLAALQVHDALNAIGFTVTNPAGMQWRAQGDDRLSVESQNIAHACIQESRRQVMAGVPDEQAIAQYLPTQGFIDPTWVTDYFSGQLGTAEFDQSRLASLRQMVNGRTIPLNYRGGHHGVSPEMTSICHQIMELLFMPATGASAVQSPSGTGLNISMLKAFLTARLGEMVSMAYMSTSAADLPPAALELYAPRDPTSRNVLPRAANDFTWEGNSLHFNLNVTDCQPGTYRMIAHVWVKDADYDTAASGQRFGRGNAAQRGGTVAGLHDAINGVTNGDGAGMGSAGGGTVSDEFLADKPFEVTIEGGGTDSRVRTQVPVVVAGIPIGDDFYAIPNRYVIISGDAAGQCPIGRSNVTADGSLASNPTPSGGALPVATGAGSAVAPTRPPVATGIADNAFRWDGSTVLFSLELDAPPAADGTVTVYVREMDWDIVGADAQVAPANALTLRVFAGSPNSQTAVYTPVEDDWNDTYVQIFSDQGCTRKLGESRSQGHDRGRIESMVGRNPATAVSGMVWSGAVLRFRVEPGNADPVYVKFFDQDWGMDYNADGTKDGSAANEDDQIGGIHTVQVNNGNAAVPSDGDEDTYAIVYKDPACTQPLHRSGTHG